MTADELKTLFLSAGADGADYVPTDRIVLSDEFRTICESNSCGKYGKCLMCPPFAGDIHELMAEVRRFSGGILYQSISELEDSFDIEGMEAAAKRHSLLSQRVQELVKASFSGDMLHLSCGGCGLCERCAGYDGEPCRFPDKALSSMEAYGINVYLTSASTSLRYVNGQNTVTYFGIVLF